MKDGIRRRIRDHIVEQWLNGDARGFDDDADQIRKQQHARR